MTDASDIETLRAQVANDLDIYKAEKERFYRLQGVEPEKISETDCKSIINWSRASIRDYSMRLEQLEDLDNPTVEQKEVMQLLNRLIMLGDEIGEITSSFIRGYEAKFGRLEHSVAAKHAPALSKVTNDKRSMTPVSAATPASPVEPPTPPTPELDAETLRGPEVDTTPATPELPETAPASTESETQRPEMSSQTPASVEEEDAEDEEEEQEEQEETTAVGGVSANPTDPKGVYAMLGVSPTAPMPEIQKAIRKMQIASHPDRNPDDPNAATHFAEFMSLCEETVKTEEKRRTYDNITTVDELEQLTKRVRQLTMNATKHSWREAVDEDQNTAELRDLVKRDTLESEHLQSRIAQLRHDILAGIPLAQGNVLSDVELQAKKQSKDLARRIEDIEDKDTQTARDREYLQALNARQVVWDRQIMQAAELRELMFEALKGPRSTVGTVGKNDQESRKSFQGAVKGVASAFESSVDTAAPTISSFVDTAATADPEPERQAPVATEESHEDEDDPESLAAVDDEDPEPDKSAWLICYRILDIDPAATPRDFEPSLKKAYKKLSRNHDPKFRPNDPEAPDRWASICKAYNLLKDPERRESYDRHGWGAGDLGGFDMARLEIGG
ncbi:hypothetical protein B0A55_02558 [Friedmanniomyces simplex]|uniref:J domain-containing protein n=1 Tax=Friedmanniomyces simplex TaxID=329884 RepID=A0A4U0XNL3_9PEZI|nr:hypothetical protein B0A55_02558 [Friedmanniomyces simplex]